MKIRFARPGGSSLSGCRVLVVATLAVSFFLTQPSRCDAKPRERFLSSIDSQIDFRTPSFRLEAMGGLTLSVRDLYTKIDLWQFAGVSAGLGLNRDSTSLDMWYNSRNRSGQRDDNGVEVETFTNGRSALLGEGVLRVTETLAFGLDVGVISVSRGLPFGDLQHTIEGVTQPVVLPVVSGRLAGPVLWGVSGILAAESLGKDWWRSVLNDGRIELDEEGAILGPPDLFTPDEGEVDVKGFGASLAYFDSSRGAAALYFDFRDEGIEWSLEGLRNSYDIDEPREIFGYGAAVIAKPLSWLDVGVDAWRESFSSKEAYRFTTSGGSIDLPFVSRGNRTLRSHRNDYFRVRFQGDVPTTKVTVGGDWRVFFDTTNETPAEAVPSDFNNFILTRVAGDTLSAPQLVLAQRRDSRVIEAGGGASYRLRDDRVIVGAEFRFFRNSIDGSSINRRPQGWQVRAGGEWRLSSRWSARAGFQHSYEDDDRLTLLNEIRREKLTLGGRFAPGQSGWVLDALATFEWSRTDFPDPRGEGGTGADFGLFLGRQF